jgi:signal transduction histidine kinase
MKHFRVWSAVKFRNTAYKLNSVIMRLGKFHRTLKLPLLQYLVIFVALFSSVVIIYFSFSYEFSWNRLRLPAEYKAGAFDLHPSTAQDVAEFRGLVQPCDKILAFDGLAVKQFSEPDIIKSVSSETIIVSTLEANFDVPISKPLKDSQIVQIWSTRANKVTLDISKCKNISETALNSRLQSCNKCITQDNSEQVQVNLAELKSKNGEFLSIVLLSLLCLSFCALGALFFILQPNRLITVVHCLFFNTVALALVVHNSVYYHQGILETTISISTFQFIPPLFLHFVLLFPDGETLSKRAKRFIKFSYLFALLILFLELYGNLMSDVEGKAVFWETGIRKLRYIEFGILFASAIGILIVKYFRSKSQNRLRLRLSVISLFVGSFPVFSIFLLNAFFGLFQDWEEHNFALLLAPALLIPSGFGYAVVKNKLLGVDLKVRRIVVRSILISLVTVLYLILTPLISSFLSFWPNLENNPVFQVGVVITLNGFCNRFRKALKTLIDKAFSVDPLNYNELARKWSNKLARTTDLEETIVSVVEHLPQDYHYKKVAILLCHPQVLELQLKTMGNTKLTNTNSPLTSIIIQTQPSITELKYGAVEISNSALGLLRQEDWLLCGYSKVSSLLETELSNSNFEAKAIIPLKLGGEFYGALFLGEKTGEFAPPPDELDFLSSIATQISASIHNSLLLAEAKAVAERERAIRLMTEARTRRDYQVRQKTLSEVADDIHGGPLQDLFHLQQNLEQISKDIDEGLPLTSYTFNTYAQSVREVITRMRRTTTALRLYGVEKDFINGIRRLIKDFKENHRAIEFTFTVSTSLSADEILSDEIKLALFRVIQEALNNAVKHSQASKMEVMLELERIQIQSTSELKAEYLLEARISDNGRGVDKHELVLFNAQTSPEQEYEQLERGEHLGIGIIKQQISQFKEIYQPEINFYSTTGSGFEVAIAMHIPAERSAMQELMLTA